MNAFKPVKYLLALALTFYLAAQVFAQAEYPGDGTPAKVPDQVMQEVVRRVLVQTFKPALKPKTIEILDNGISLSWLPIIRNVKFRLVLSSEKHGDIYFFTKPELSKKTYKIGLAFGDPECSAIGDTWNFRIVIEKITLWKNGGFGMGCSGTMSSGIATGSGQSNH
jgi:hypothetical protein